MRDLDTVVRRVREECRAVIDSLVASEFLRWTAAGAVTRGGT
jgi:hypothetical protein